MTEEVDRAAAGWFAAAEDGGIEATATAIREGSADRPAAWPDLAVEAGFAESVDRYDERLHEAAVQATEAAIKDREQAGDQEIKHAVRALDDLDRVGNELSERIGEWAGSRVPDAEIGPDAVSEVTDLPAKSELDQRLAALAEIVAELNDQRAGLEAEIERAMPTVAPNLSALAGPLLGARLIALAGDLERLAKLPSGTVQVLGAEDALFAHLHGEATSPKHGVIYVHEYVRGTAAEHRGSAARALAGKLSIAARIDHYAGDVRPDLQAELDERIARIRERES